MLAWSVALALALVIKLGEYRRAAGPALPADIYLPNIAVRFSMIAYLVTPGGNRCRADTANRKHSRRRAAGFGVARQLLITAVVPFPRPTFHPPGAAYQHCSCSSET
jgi:hypothetical protein